MALIDRIEGDVELVALDAYTYAVSAASDAYEYTAFDNSTWAEDELAQRHIEAAAQNFKVWARKQIISEYMAFIRKQYEEKKGCLQ